MFATIQKRLKYLLAPESPVRMRKRMKQAVHSFSQTNLRRNWFRQAEDKLW